MTFRVLRRFGSLLGALCAGCGGTSALQGAPQPQSEIPPAATTLVATTSSQITGTATSCSSFYSCVYAITNIQGKGWARTSALVSFQLPGEAKSTTSFSWKPATVGQSGNTYHINGPFIAVDANTEQIINGVTDDFIIQTKHCFRSCSYTYTLSSGTITFNPTNLDATTTSVACNPSSFSSGGSTVCTATVTDLANSTHFATGSVSFAISSYYGVGTFTPPTCTLSSGACSTTFRPSDESVGGIGIRASYPGDSTHYLSSGNTTIYVNGD